MEFIEKFIIFIINQKRFIRRLILCSIDIILLTISLLLSNIIIYDNFVGNKNLSDLFLVTIFLNTIGLFIFISLGKYKGITKYANSIDLYSLVFKNLLIFFSLKLILNLLNINYINLKFLFLLWIIQTVLIGATNFVLRDILQIINSDKYYKKTKVAIYGASSKGAQLAASIRLDFNYKIIAFFDDRKSLWGRNIGGIKIFNPKKIEKFKGEINKIFLSEPKNITSDKKFDLIYKLSSYGIDILEPAPLEKVKKPTKSSKPSKTKTKAKKANSKKSIENLTTLPGVGAKCAKALYEAGFKTTKAVISAEEKDLLAVSGVGINLVKKLKKLK